MDMGKKVFKLSIAFWLAVEEAGLDIDDVARLMVEVPKATELVDTVVEKGKKVFIFTNHSSHIDCRIVGVRTEILLRFAK